MDINHKFYLKVLDSEQKEVFTFNKGQVMTYKEIKNEIINEMENINQALPLLEGDFYLTIICESGELYQCIQYKWLCAQFLLDNTKTKDPFSFLLDCLFLYGEWINFKTPKELFNELNDNIQTIKNKKNYSKNDTKKVNENKIINGKPIKELDKLQKEYDKLRIEHDF